MAFPIVLGHRGLGKGCVTFIVPKKSLNEQLISRVISSLSLNSKPMEVPGSTTMPWIDIVRINGFWMGISSSTNTMLLESKQASLREKQSSFLITKNARNTMPRNHICIQIFLPKLFPLIPKYGSQLDQS